MQTDDGMMIAAAEAEMARQLALCDGYAFSLDGLWHACGRPAGKGPAEWVELAQSLIRGLAGYFTNPDRWKGEATPCHRWPRVRRQSPVLSPFRRSAPSARLAS